ncbi:hypothetical protein DCS_01769 [Drechmeria coniospora]|uniref:Uncharacterized protein n=1 Tax=Drechmeria coniospora TaxID=98403 RepID=A0A151GU80_DRECN|nr:hypothetical protein DCS_01769 [Drechmeria coniospora]KYK60631.1 hypothetical protein DCS_01769 [Drechmeria coniospora]
MLADALRAFYDTNIALINSDAICCDRIVDTINGAPLCIRDTLENSVSDANADGLFLQLSGLRFTVDWSRP